MKEILSNIQCHTFFLIRKWSICHSSTHQPNVQVCDCTWSVYKAFPHISTARDKRWGE